MYSDPGGIMMKTKLKVAQVLSVVGVLASLLTLFSVPSDTAAAHHLK
jgi:hypothetical protein